MTIRVAVAVFLLGAGVAANAVAGGTGARTIATPVAIDEHVGQALATSRPPGLSDAVLFFLLEPRTSPGGNCWGVYGVAELDTPRPAARRLRASLSAVDSISSQPGRPYESSCKARA